MYKIHILRHIYSICILELSKKLPSFVITAKRNGLMFVSCSIPFLSLEAAISPKCEIFKLFYCSSQQCHNSFHTIFIFRSIMFNHTQITIQSTIVLQMFNRASPLMCYQLSFKACECQWASCIQAYDILQML